MWKDPIMVKTNIQVTDNDTKGTRSIRGTDEVREKPETQGISQEQKKTTIILDGPTRNHNGTQIGTTLNDHGPTDHNNSLIITIQTREIT